MGDGEASGSVPSEPVSSTEDVGVPALVNRTARNSSLAEALMRASVFSSGTPGMDTMMLVSPCVVT